MRLFTVICHWDPTPWEHFQTGHASLITVYRSVDNMGGLLNLVSAHSVLLLLIRESNTEFIKSLFYFLLKCFQKLRAPRDDQYPQREGVSAHFTQPLNSHQIILRLHKLLPHLTALPFVLPGLDLSRIERPLVQVVFLLLLLGKKRMG